MILYLLLILIVIIIIAAAITAKDARNKALTTANILMKMEANYDTYITAALNQSELKNLNLEIDSIQLAKDALIHLNEEIDTITHLLNSNTRSLVQINYSARFFPNLIDMIETHYRTFPKNKSNTTFEIEIQALKDATLDAIQTDIERRLLNLDIEIH